MSGRSLAGSPAHGEAELLAAYLGSIYSVSTDDGGFELRVGQCSPRAPAADRVHAVLTACNPRSAPLPDLHNALRMQRLRSRVTALSIRWQEATGRSTDRSWVEPSLWLQDIGLDTLDALAAEFEQNATVVVGADAQVLLRIHRPDWRAVIGDDPRWQWSSIRAA